MSDETDEPKSAAKRKPAPPASEPEGPPPTPELGPVIPEGGEPEPFESVGNETGVQPLTPDEIPEAGR